MSSYRGYVPIKYLPSLESLMEAIRLGSQDSTTNELNQNYDITNVGFPIDGKLVKAERDGYRGNPRIPTAWSKRVLSGAITVSDMYRKRHPIHLPSVSECNNASERSSREVILDDDAQAHLIPTSIFVTYSLLGINRKDWAKWSMISNDARFPHQVYEYNLICEKFRVPHMTPAQYSELTKSLRDRVRGILPLDWITKWAHMAKDLDKARVDHTKIEDLGAWVVDDWGPASIALLTRAGITHKMAAEMWNAGVKDACTIFKCVTEGLPLEWAIHIHNARELSYKVDN